MGGVKKRMQNLECKVQKEGGLATDEIQIEHGCGKDGLIRKTGKKETMRKQPWQRSGKGVEQERMEETENGND